MSLNSDNQPAAVPVASSAAPTPAQAPPTNRLDRLFAFPMFVASIGFLLVLGAMLHLEEGHLFETPLGVRCVIALAILYPLFAIEALAHLVSGSRQMRQHIWYLIMPVFRLCGRDHVDGTHVWLPLLGWRETDRTLEKLLSRRFSIPMIIIALLVLPVVVFELFWSDWIAASARLTFTVQTVTGWIWMAFVFEFVIMISVVERKLAYCRKNWIDLAVILLPMLSFMRAARLGTLAQLKQLSKTARVYRLRGLALRTWRAIVTLDVVDMILQRDPKYRIEKLEEEIAERHEEMTFLKSELKRLQKRVADQEAAEAESAAEVPEPDEAVEASL